MIEYEAVVSQAYSRGTSSFSSLWLKDLMTK